MKGEWSRISGVSLRYYLLLCCVLVGLQALKLCKIVQFRCFIAYFSFHHFLIVFADLGGFKFVMAIGVCREWRMVRNFKSLSKVLSFPYVFLMLCFNRFACIGALQLISL